MSAQTNAHRPPSLGTCTITNVRLSRATSSFSPTTCPDPTPGRDDPASRTPGRDAAASLASLARGVGRTRDAMRDPRCAIRDPRFAIRDPRAIVSCLPRRFVVGEVRPPRLGRPRGLGPDPGPDADPSVVVGVAGAHTRAAHALPHDSRAHRSRERHDDAAVESPASTSRPVPPTPRPPCGSAPEMEKPATPAWAPLARRGGGDSRRLRDGTMRLARAS